MSNIKHHIDPVFEEDPVLKIREELLSIHAINPFVGGVSSSRSAMVGAHLSQMITLKNGNERILQTGLEKQLGDNTFSVKLEHDSRSVALLSRYSGVDISTATETAQLLYIYEDLTTNELCCAVIPKYHKLHPYFGFEYVWNTNVLNSITYNKILPAGTILADSPSVKENSGYAFGRNANLALLSIPEVTEDGVVISDSLAENLRYDIFETRTIEFGLDSFPLNLYGDADNYKAFPDIGDTINSDSVLMATREYDNRLNPALMSISDVMDFDPTFDVAHYVKGPGYKAGEDGHTTDTGVIVDIIAHNIPRFKKSPITGTTDGVTRYVNGLKKYYTDLIKVYEDQSKEHYSRYRNNDMKVSKRLHRILLDAYAVVNPAEHKIKLTRKNVQLDLYSISFVIKYNIRPTIGGKLSDLFGAKGVIVDIWEDERMPYNPSTGERADIIMDSTSIVGRLNSGRLYEHYFNGMSRTGKRVVTAMVNSIGKPIEVISTSEIDEVWNKVLGLTEILGTEQHEYYLGLTYPEKREVISDIVNNEFYIYYKVSSEKKPYQIVVESKDTEYEPVKDHLIFYSSDGKKFTTKDKLMIAPEYIILLAKTADNYLAASSSKINHYGMPIGSGSGSRNRLPWKMNATKNLSETEVRLYSSYVGRKGLIEMKDRGSSINTHKHIYTNTLLAEQPTNIDKIIDRNEVPYGGDASLELINNIFNAAGISIEYVKDSHKIHPMMD